MSLANFAACVLSPYANKKRANVSDNRLSLHQTPTYAGPVSADLLPKTLSVALIITQKDTAPLKQPALIKEAPPLYPLISLALPTLQVTPELFACVCVCESRSAVACEPGWDKVMKILLPVQGASNYKQAYFSIQLKLTDWQEQLSAPPSGDMILTYEESAFPVWEQNRKCHNTIPQQCQIWQEIFRRLYEMEGTCFVALLIYTPLPHWYAAAGRRAWCVPCMVKHGGNRQCSSWLVMICSNTQADSCTYRGTAIPTSRQTVSTLLGCFNKLFKTFIPHNCSCLFPFLLLSHHLLLLCSFS